MEAPRAVGTELVWFCHLLCGLPGKVKLVLDHALYHNSRMVKKFVAKCRGWLRLHLALKYMPNDNAAEVQWVSAKLALDNKLLQRCAHMSEALGEAVRAGPPVAAYMCAKAAAARVGRGDADGMATTVSGKHEHFCYVDLPPPTCRRARIPTAEGLRQGRE